jgi:molecular chaperone GrpE (heat shock protein)
LRRLRTETMATRVMIQLEKKLTALLRTWQVEVIDLSSKRIEVGKVRVLEARKNFDHPDTHAIIEVCRKGYQRGAKIIRPADVITS